MRSRVRTGVVLSVMFTAVACAPEHVLEGGGADGGVASTTQHTLLGQLLRMPSCTPDSEGARCVPEPVAGVELCAITQGERTCAVTDSFGKLVFDSLPSDRVRFELEAGANPGHYVVAATLASDDSQPTEWVADMALTADALTLTLAEGGRVRDAVANTLRITSLPFGQGDTSGDVSPAQVVLPVTAAPGDDDDTVRVALDRLPLGGESWTVTADRSPACDTCTAGRVEIARLTSVRTDASLPDAARLSARSALPAEVGEWIEKAAPSGSAVAAIDAAHRRLGGNAGLLGAPTAAHFASARSGARRNYQRGAILWTANTGAREVHGAILTLYDAWGGETGAFGYPLTDETATADNAGRRNFFEFAAIYWKSSTGAHSVYGALLGRYGELGAETGTLGYPTSDSLIAPDGVGVFNYFERGALYWHPSYGARLVRGKILERWGALGWEAGRLGYPTSDEYTSQGRARSDFERGSIDFRTRAPQIKVYSQNMGILVWPATYGGVDSGNALSSLITILDTERPDIVALQEVFDDGWYESLIRDSRIAALYPHRRHGPVDPELTNALDSDGGLVILSRLPVTSWDETVFRTCAGEDCAAAKGVMHARVQVLPDLSYDVFNTHLNNDEPEIGSPFPAYRSSTTQKQINAALSFIQSKRGARQAPAILMGDFNVPGEDSEAYIDLLARLGFPTDAWMSTHVNSQGFLTDPGITFDEINNFEPSDREPLASERGKQGSRLDYLFLFDGTRQRAWAERLDVFRGRARLRDLSDHYGLMGVLGHTEEINTTYNRSFSWTDVRMRGFYVHDLTSFTSSADEVTFDMRVRFDGGAEQFSTTADPLTANDVDTSYSYRRSPWAQGGPIQSSVRVALEGWEHDSVGRDSLGARSLTFTKEDLLNTLVHGTRFRVGLHDRQDGEYTSEISLDVR